VREKLGEDDGALSAYAEAANVWAALNDASSEAIAKLKIGVLRAHPGLAGSA
jgi:2-oxo-4-hydroxy-4-carboxy--5-ureidoimidazoline (OHCU) decarboxylase